MLHDVGDQDFDQHWHNDFRMTLPTIMRIVELVRPRLEKSNTD